MLYFDQRSGTTNTFHFHEVKRSISFWFYFFSFFKIVSRKRKFVFYFYFVVCWPKCKKVILFFWGKNKTVVNPFTLQKLFCESFHFTKNRQFYRHRHEKSSVLSSSSREIVSFIVSRHEKSLLLSWVVTRNRQFYRHRHEGSLVLSWVVTRNRGFCRESSREKASIKKLERAFRAAHVFFN